MYISQLGTETKQQKTHGSGLNLVTTFKCPGKRAFFAWGPARAHLRQEKKHADGEKFAASQWEGMSGKRIPERKPPVGWLPLTSKIKLHKIKLHKAHCRLSYSSAIAHEDSAKGRFRPSSSLLRLVEGVLNGLNWMLHAPVVLEAHLEPICDIKTWGKLELHRTWSTI